MNVIIGKLIIPYIINNHQSVLPKDKFFTANSDSKAVVLPKCRSSTANSGTKAAVLPRGRSSTANSGTMVVVLLRMNRSGSFPLLSVSHSC